MLFEKYAEEAVEIIKRWTDSDWWALIHSFKQYGFIRMMDYVGVPGSIVVSRPTGYEAGCICEGTFTDNPDPILLFWTVNESDLAIKEFESVLLIGSECNCNCGHAYLIAIRRTDEVPMKLDHELYAALLACGVRPATAAILATET